MFVWRSGGNMLVNAGVELVEAWGSLVDPHTVAVRRQRGGDGPPDRTLTASKILVRRTLLPSTPQLSHPPTSQLLAVARGKGRFLELGSCSPPPTY